MQSESEQRVVALGVHFGAWLPLVVCSGKEPGEPLLRLREHCLRYELHMYID